MRIVRRQLFGYSTSRRDFLQTTGIAAGGLMTVGHLSGCIHNDDDSILGPILDPILEAFECESLLVCFKRFAVDIGMNFLSQKIASFAPGLPGPVKDLVSIMNDEKAHTGARVAASNAILDRGYGKPPASVKMEHEGQSAAEQWISVLKDLDGIRKKDKQPKPTTALPDGPSVSGSTRTATPTAKGTDTIQ